MSQSESKAVARAARITVLGEPAKAASNAIWGMALFMAAEVAIFGTLIGSYFYLDTTDAAWPPYGIKAPAVLAPLLLTALLVATSFPINFAARAARGGRRNGAVIWILVAMIFQAGYLGAQIELLTISSHSFTPQGSAYGSIYYTLLVAHHIHVAFGVALDLAIVSQLMTRGITRYWLLATRNLALYWYVVNGLAIAVVFTQLSPSL